MEWTEELIEQLISCPKLITHPPQRDYKYHRKQYQKNFGLMSVDELHDFDAFIRWSAEFPENFSVGLQYKSRGDLSSITLLRCNGSHGPSKSFPHHQGPHLHRPDADDIRQGRLKERNISIVDAYHSVEQAIQYFIQQTNITNAYLYFSTPNLFDPLSSP